MIRRKRELALGASRMLGVSGIRQIGNMQTAAAFGSGNLGVTASASGCQKNDLILVLGCNKTAGAADLSVAATGLSFTLIAKTTQVTNEPIVAAWYAIAPDTTARDVTVTAGASGSTSGRGMQVIVLRGVDVVVPLDTGVNYGRLAANTSFTVPVPDPETPGALAVTWQDVAVSNAVLAVTSPSGFTTDAAGTTVNGWMSGRKIVSPGAPPGDTTVTSTGSGVLSYLAFNLRALQG